MGLLQTVARIFCLLPILTGTMDIVEGARSLSHVGSGLGDDAFADPVLDSQIRFLGAIWFGYGVCFWRAANQIGKQDGWFRLLVIVLFCSGICRSISALEVGFPGGALTAGAFLELIGAPLFLIWHGIILRRVHN